MPGIKTDDGITLNVEVAADDGRPALVFSNSLGTDHRMWDDQVDALADTFRIVRYDSRGHGCSDVPAGAYTIERLGRDIIGILEGLGIASANYCGLSLGGMVGQWLGINAPDRIDRLVLSNTSARMEPASMWQERIDLVMSSGMAPVAEGAVERWFTPGFRRQRPDDVDRIRAMLLATDPVGYAGCSAAIRDMDQRRAITAIRLPTLIIAGEKDPATPPDHARLIHSAIAGSRLEIIADAAHLANIEQDARYNRLLLEFLTG